MANEVTEEQQKEANKLISDKLEQVYALIKECEKIADENQVSFNFQVEYGMGGYYYPKEKDEEGNWKESSSEVGWHASSQDC
jgi:hypothetical protein